MTFTFDCPHCGRANHADLGHVGRTAPCPGCNQAVVVPAPLEAADAPPGVASAGPSPTAVRFACPTCGRKFATKVGMAGKRVVCSGCGTKLAVPGGPPPSSSGAVPTRTDRPPSRADVRPASSPSIDTYDLGGDAAPGALPVDAPVLTAGGRGRGRRDGGELVESVLPSRSEAMADLERSLAEKAKVEEEKKAKRAKKARKGKKRASAGLEPKEVAQMIGGGVALVALLGGLSYAAPNFRLPIGGVLCVIGGLVYFLGTLGFSHVAREEGAIYSLCCKFVPLYKWYYLVTRWEEMRGHFALYAVGLVLLGPGVWIVKESPYYKRIDAIEKAGMMADDPDESEDAAPPPIVPAPVVPMGGDGRAGVE